MAQKQPGQDGPSLELPSLGFGRKRKRSASSEEEPAPDTAATSEPPAPDAATDPAPDATPPADPTPEPAAATPRQEPPPDPAPPLFADEVPAQQPESPDDDSSAAPVTRERRGFRLPSVGAMPAAMATGAVVGALLVGLTWGALRLCELVQGTSSCGNPGFFLLLAIAVAMVLLGKVLLAGFDVPEPGSTSFLGVGLVVVIALLFLVDLLFYWWMILVIPAVGLATYALSHWVTTAFVDVPDDDLHR